MPEPSDTLAAEIDALRAHLTAVLGDGWEAREMAHHAEPDGTMRAVCLPIRAAIRLLPTAVQPPVWFVSYDEMPHITEAEFDLLSQFAIPLGPARTFPNATRRTIDFDVIEVMEGGAPEFIAVVRAEA